MSDEDDGDFEAHLFFSLRLIIRHPDIDPARITEVLGLVPHPVWRAGDERRTPKGGLLPGRHRDTAWGHSIKVTGRRAFFSEVPALLDKLEPQADFLRELHDTGGRVSMDVSLPGAHNAGDALDWHDLGRLAALRIRLGLEVFPDWDPPWAPPPPPSG